MLPLNYFWASEVRKHRNKLSIFEFIVGFLLVVVIYRGRGRVISTVIICNNGVLITASPDKYQ